MPVAITEVDCEKDLPFLAEINRRTFLQELPSRFAYKPLADVDGTGLAGFFQDRLVGRLSQPHARMFKAANPDTDQIYGFACWRRVGGAGGGEPVAAPAPAPVLVAAKTAPQLPPFMNAEFTVATGAEVKQLEDHMTGEHYCMLFGPYFVCYRGLTVRQTSPRLPLIPITKIGASALSC
ncbi:hypothetical protein SAMD00023353_3700960 [Rosellinia necatrix]|uniref:Uncharacterized protein n=1 Tax=Rosellinia necatrix TaxID=77044 RepID=A0A1W2TM08_ROSNE|nr:hypothetical protein SAMD00023353_3700960 [Rosellinia necatrix]